MSRTDGRSGGSFHARHDGSAELVDAEVDGREEEQEEGERPGLANSHAARQAQVAREQRREQEEAEALQDPRLRALAAALPPPPSSPSPSFIGGRRTYSTADGVDGPAGNAGAAAGEGEGAASGEDRTAGATARDGTDGRNLLAPPPPPPCAPPLADGWRPLRREGE